MLWEILWYPEKSLCKNALRRCLRRCRIISGRRVQGGVSARHEGRERAAPPSRPSVDMQSAAVRQG